ncbi:MAG: serine hydrolase [Patescibacteria group bacterium]|nr:serine hydrolase [Patescibacteria group bacterium]
MKKINIFLFSLIFSFVFCFGINIFAGNLEKYFLAQISCPAQKNLIIYEEFLNKHKKQDIEIEKPEIIAKSAICVKINEKGEQKTIFEKNSDEILGIASLSKLATAIIVFEYPEYYDFSKIIVISKQAIEQEETIGELTIGEKISVRDLMHIMLMESSNDAAFALSEEVGDYGDDPFVFLMNSEAKKNIELENTKFVNPTGLDPDESNAYINVSTSRDLAKLNHFILRKYPEIFEISSKLSHSVLSNAGKTHHIAINRNKLLDPDSKFCVNDAEWQKKIPYIVGGKTGFTNTAGGTMILILKNKKQEYYINVILGTKTPNQRFIEMKKLVNYTFNF